MYEAKFFAFSPNVLYVYNENSQSTTRSEFNLKKMDMMWAWEQQECFFDELKFFSMKRAVEIRHIYTASVLYSKMKKASTSFCKEAVRFRKKILKDYHHTFKYPEFIKKDILFVLENFFPIPLTIYWFIVNRIFKRK